MAKIVPGQRFGILTVEYETDERKGRYRVWHCRCDCGKGIDLSTRDLHEKKIGDCGCRTHAKRVINVI
ncbi:MAG: hypothetical protein LUD01_10180 [Clostridiales bacterium]|nr:hypothetical protein [Clostridiales bacterium]